MSSLLTQAWSTGRLMRPDASRLNSVDMIRALASLGGVVDLDLGQGAKTIAGRIGGHDHLVFVLIDAMGINLLGRLPGGAFLPAHQVMELQAVFPSTTAAAITTLATGMWPSEHGVLGWWAYLAEHGLSVVTLPFVERMSNRPLRDLGVMPTALWPFPPLLARMNHRPLSIQPAIFLNSEFTRFTRGGCESNGYMSIDSAVDQVVDRVISATGPTYTYVYLPELDDVCHDHGTDSAPTLEVLTYLDAQMERLATGLRGRARLVISADHGHLNVAPADHLAIRDGDELLATLIVPPTGESRVPYFHVREGKHDAFLRLFEERYGRRFALLSVAEADAMRLFGPQPLSATARRRLGDYVGIALEAVTLKYYPPDPKATEDHVSHHAGMTPEEMRVPLIVV